MKKVIILLIITFLSLILMAQTLRNKEGLRTKTNANFNIVTAETIISDNATKYFGVVSLADHGEYNLPAARAGIGQVKATGAWCFFHFTEEGVPTLEDHVNGSTTHDNNATLNVTDGGDYIIIQNELGSTLNVLIDVTYYVP